MRPLKKTIDTQALAHNFRVLAEIAAPAALTAVVKANAYGHDAVLCAKALAPHAQNFAAACIEEALQLRQAGITQPVILLEGIFSPDEAALCAAQNFHPVIHNRRQLDWLKTAPSPLKCWLKIDSGMHRLGFAPVQESLTQAQSINADWQGILSHFACADEEDLSHARAQLQRLESLDLPAGWQKCYANSAAIFALQPELQKAGTALARPGILLYGLSPFAGKTAADLGLKPVMTLESEILAVRKLDKDDTAGYGQGFTAPAAGNLATIALGYGDGFNRSIASGCVFVRIAGKRYPLVGRIAMDMSLVWLGDDDYPAGTSVTIFGTDNPAEIMAQEAGTIPYTLTTMLTPRVQLRTR